MIPQQAINAPVLKTIMPVAYRDVSARIDELLDALLHTEETDVMSRIEAYRKLVKELGSAGMSIDETNEALQEVKYLHIQAKLLIDHQKSDFLRAADEFENILRHKINDIKNERT